MKNKLILILSLQIIISEILVGQNINWTQKQSLPKAYRNGGAAACNGKIYFMGGYCDATPERFEKSNYEYDPAADTWITKKEIPTGRTIRKATHPGLLPKNHDQNDAKLSAKKLKYLKTPRMLRLTAMLAPTIKRRARIASRR